MRFSQYDKFLFYEELAKLTGAGFSMVEAANSMLENGVPPAQSAYLNGLKSGVDGRMTVAGAIDSLHELPITPLEKSVIEAAERGGKLPEGFAHLAAYFDMAYRAARQIRRKMIYPIVLLNFALFLPILVSVVLAVVNGQPLVAVLTKSTLLVIAIYGLIAALWFAGRSLHRKSSNSSQADRLLRKLPMVGKMREALAMSRFCKVFEIFLLSGQRIDVGLHAAADASQSALLVDAIRSRVSPGLEQGARVGPLLPRNVFPPAFARSYASAEESGTLDRDMARWSEVYQDEAVSRMQALADWAPRMFYTLIAAFAVVQIFLLYNKYLKAVTSLLD